MEEISKEMSVKDINEMEEHRIAMLQEAGHGA